MMIGGCNFFKNQNISLDVFSSYKLGWLSDMNGKYEYEDGILDICENTLINLEKLKLKVEFLNPDFDCEALWKSWVTFRSKGIYEDTLSMNLENIDSMTFQAIWEYNLGSNISDNDLNIALEQKNKCSQQIDNIFSNYDGSVRDHTEAIRLFHFNNYFSCSIRLCFGRAQNCNFVLCRSLSVIYYMVFSRASIRYLFASASNNILEGQHA